MYDDLRNIIRSTIEARPPDAVLFSGGVDSSVIAYEVSRINPNFEAVTVGVDGLLNSDVEYSRLVAKQLNFKNHIIKIVTDEDVLKATRKAVSILKSFNPEWICSTITLLLSTEKNTEKIYSTGEGSDDLFGSFPFFDDWDETLMPLTEAIEKRLEDIKVMSRCIFEHENIKYTLPYYSENVKKAILSIPIAERVKKTQVYSSKYPLRVAYQDYLPIDAIRRPQTMAFHGSGIYHVLKKHAAQISDEEIARANQQFFVFSSKLEYYLFRIYLEIFNDFKMELVSDSENKVCIHCYSKMKKKSLICSKCNMYQIKNREVTFGES